MPTPDPTQADWDRVHALPSGVFRQALTDRYGADDDGLDLSAYQLRQVLARADELVLERQIAQGLVFAELFANARHVEF